MKYKFRVFLREEELMWIQQERVEKNNIYKKATRRTANYSDEAKRAHGPVYGNQGIKISSSQVTPKAIQLADLFRLSFGPLFVFCPARASLSRWLCELKLNIAKKLSAVE